MGNSTLRISEAASIAMHAAALLAAGKNKSMSNKDIALTLRISEAHLSKVLQRLTRAGIVRAVRGPKGGYTLSKSPDVITLLDVYEAIEGPLVADDCLFGTRICTGKKCILGKMTKVVNRQFRHYLMKTSLSKVSGVFVNVR